MLKNQDGLRCISKTVLLAGMEVDGEESSTIFADDKINPPRLVQAQSPQGRQDLLMSVAAQARKQILPSAA
jgi:hypothetical protein